MTKRTTNLLLMLGVALVVLVLDMLSKAWVSANIADHSPRPIIEGFLRLRYTQNTGAAFGMLQGWTGALSIAAVAIIAAILLSAARMGNHNRLLVPAVGLVLGGAIGNLYDRLTLGYVRDFIEVYGPHIEWEGRIYTFPVFNVADSAITVGVILIMAVLLFSKTSVEKPRAEGEEQPQNVPAHSGLKIED
jgi:signal peptidase II